MPRRDLRHQRPVPRLHRAGCRAALDQEPDLDGTQFACVISRQAVSKDGATGTDADYVAVNDKVYVYGDARMQW